MFHYERVSSIRTKKRYKAAVNESERSSARNAAFCLQASLSLEEMCKKRSTLRKKRFWQIILARSQTHKTKQDETRAFQVPLSVKADGRVRAQSTETSAAQQKRSFPNAGIFPINGRRGNNFRGAGGEWVRVMRDKGTLLNYSHHLISFVRWVWQQQGASAAALAAAGEEKNCSGPRRIILLQS